ncbi:LPS export ABC transporter periplasmic protein LptC [Candidatus Endolissoclinum faulkneri]|nr:LPS export ABC transporter periplasmic protein LptC [Candidatus Endolissoclinum faulkneri]
MKVLLLIIAIGLIAVVLISLKIGHKFSHIRKNQALINQKDFGNMRMINPRIIGLNESNKPFEIIAHSATQPSDGKQIVILDHPQANMENKDGTLVTVKAAAGKWIRESNIINLTDGVILSNNAGYQLVTEKATIDLRQGKVFSKMPTWGYSPDAKIQGQSMQILCNGSRIIFIGKTKAFLLQDQN